MRHVAVESSVQLITCPELGSLPGVKHAFFTRQGGVSAGIYASLNCGYGSGDKEENIRKNRYLAMQALGLRQEAVHVVDDRNLEPGLCTLYQVHSTDVIDVVETWDAERHRPEADAMVTNTPGIVLGILTADCVPVLFADAKNRVVGAAHAGWKGAFAGVLENTVAAMEKKGADKSDIYAAIGPCIRQRSYEVGPEFYEHFIRKDKSYNRFFINANREFHYFFDLAGFVTARLETLGLAMVADIKRDTCAESDFFFSYRRNCLEGQKDYGRLLSSITLK